MRKIGAAIWAFALALGAAAAGPATHDVSIPLTPNVASDTEAVVIPANSPVKLKNFDRSEPAAHFEGEFLLTGRWEIYSGDDSDAGNLDPFLVPDPSVAKTLPHWHDRGGPNAIGINNADKFIAAVIPKQTWNLLKSKKLRQAGGRIAIWVKNYDISIVCDSPEYDVDFVRVAQPVQIATNLHLENGGCL